MTNGWDKKVVLGIAIPLLAAVFAMGGFAMQINALGVEAESHHDATLGEAHPQAGARLIVMEQDTKYIKSAVDSLVNTMDGLNQRLDSIYGKQLKWNEEN